MQPSFSAASSAKVLKIIYDYEMACCAYTAAKLNMAELLYDGPRTVAELAAAAGADAPSLYRVLRVLAGEGLFKETDKEVFAFTPEALALYGETEGSIKYFLQAILGEHYHGFGNMLHSVRTGETAFDHYYKMDVWEYYGKHPETAVNFNKAMAGLTQYYSRAILAAYDFSPFHTIIDIGGGNGALLFAILNQAQASKGIIVDAPAVIQQTEMLIRDHHLQDRCSAMPGNFFEHIPEGGDAYLLKYILHDWSDQESIRILENCAKAMKQGSKVLVFDAVIPPGNDWHPGKHTDVTMLVATKGRERSEDDFRHLFKAAGLQFNKITALELDEISIVEAEKIAHPYNT
jgi:hypothetical protein